MLLTLIILIVIGAFLSAALEDPTVYKDKKREERRKKNIAKHEKALADRNKFK